MRTFSLAVLVAALAFMTLIMPTSAQEYTYATRNGPRTATQLTSELQRAGYSGPWDVSMMLAAYQRAGGPKLSVDGNGVPRQQCFSGSPQGPIVLVHIGPAACEIDTQNESDLSYGYEWPAPYAVICKGSLPRNHYSVDTEIVIARNTTDSTAIGVCNSLASGPWAVNWFNNGDIGGGVRLEALP